MTTKAPRIILLILLVLLGGQLSAGGSREAGSSQDATTRYISAKTLAESGVTASDVLVDTLTSLASVMDHVTRVMAYQLSPFPSVMQWFDGKGKTADDLRKNSVESFGYDATALGKAYDEARTTASGGLASSSTDNGEKTRWNLVSSLFVIFLVCESIWTAIQCYFNREKGTLATLFADVVACVVLYLLCAAVPFIVQASVFGFQRMAYVMSTGSMDMGADEVASSQIYRLPGDVIRESSDVLYFLDARSLSYTNDWSLDQVQDENGHGILWFLNHGLAGVLERGAIWMIYTAMKIIASLIIIRVALHVMLNVLEVYLLIGAVMCLIPFRVFSPIKWLGQGALRSLASNIVELFVIFLIFFSTRGIIGSARTGIYEVLRLQESEPVITCDTTNAAFQSGMAEAGDSGFTESEILQYAVDHSMPVSAARQILYHTQVEKSEEGALYPYLASAHTSWNSPMQERCLAAVKGYLDDIIRKENAAGATFLTADGSQAESYSELSNRDKTELLQDVFIDGLYDSTLTGAVSITSSAAMDWSIVPAHIVTCLFLLLVQLFFLSNSSQITSALLGGGISHVGREAQQVLGQAKKVGMFALGGELLVGKAIGAGNRILGNPAGNAVRKVAGAASSQVKAAVRGAWNAATGKGGNHGGGDA